MKYTSVRQLAIRLRQGFGGNRQLAIGNRQSAIGNRQTAIGNWQLAIGNRQSAIGDRQLANPDCIGAGCETANRRAMSFRLRKFSY